MSVGLLRCFKLLTESGPKNYGVKNYFRFYVEIIHFYTHCFSDYGIRYLKHTENTI